MLWLIVCSYHVTYSFHCESTLHSCLNVKELIAQSRRHIWRLSDCNGTRLASFAKLLSDRSQTKWLLVRVPLQSLRLLLLGKFCVLCFLVTIIFLWFAPLPYYQRIKAVVSKIIFGAVSGYFEKNILQTNPTFLLFFLIFVYLSTFLILLNLIHANNTFPYVKRSENYWFSGVFRRYINGTLAWNGLTMENASNLNVRHSINRSVFYNKQ